MAKNEKDRKLTAAEERRLTIFESKKKTLKKRGYKETELTIGIVKANIIALIMAVPVSVVAIALFFLLNRSFYVDTEHIVRDNIIFFVSIFLLIVVHELVHGITWAVMSPNHFKDIEFGFMLEYLTPYCTCKEPLRKGPYIMGALMPLIVLGIIPLIVGIATGSFFLLAVGIVMTVTAAGDMMIVYNILKYKTDSKDVLIVDHPTQGGSVVFER